jgi:hypothetical protein
MEMIMSLTYLTTDELSSRIKYDARTIRDRLKDSVLIEGTEQSWAKSSHGESNPRFRPQESTRS